MSGANRIEPTTILTNALVSIAAGRIYMKFFAGPRCEGPNPPNNLTPLLRASTDISPQEQLAGALPARVDNIDEADFVALPKVWSVYATSRELNEPMALFAQARRAGKPFLVWHTGDLNPILPFGEALVMVNAVDRERRPPNWFVAPRFFEDPASTYSSLEADHRAKQLKPRIGFCGYAATNPFKLSYSVLDNLRFHAMHAAGRTAYQPPPVIPATVLRARVLNTLSRSSSVETSFVIRSRYKTGTTHDFYANILDTDYTVCIRGYGNWSVRLYETLACGRIPIFIDTDCGLPFDHVIDWKHYCVWVPTGDISHAAEYAAEFHSRLSPKDFRARQRECRQLWADRLTLRGFLSHFHEHFTGVRT